MEPLACRSQAHLRLLLRALEELAPLQLAGKWDNVGLLVAHSRAAPLAAPYNVLLTNDITPLVLERSLSCFSGSPASFILSYHPTPFSALKQFSMESFPARVVLTAAAHNMAVFSPHTSWDAAPQGLNDWLLEGLVQRAGCSLAAPARPVKPCAEGPGTPSGSGDGRMGRLASPCSLAQLLAGVKAHLGLEAVALALPAALLATTAAGSAAVAAAAEQLQVASVAVCAGSGAGVLGGLRGMDVWVTGELSHHDVLAATAGGTAVILTHHSKCERGFLPVMEGRLRAALQAAVLEDGSAPNFVWQVSSVDADPLVTV
jgi:dinuclear metal center YbgI/SA1388 family protein